MHALQYVLAVRSVPKLNRLNTQSHTTWYRSLKTLVPSTLNPTHSPIVLRSQGPLMWDSEEQTTSLDAAIMNETLKLHFKHEKLILPS